MALVPIDKLEIDNRYVDHFSQTGQGIDIPVYRGGATQIGHGIGSIFSGLLKSAVPLLKSGVISLGTSALKPGINVAKDAVEGKNIKQSLTNNLKRAGGEALYNLLTHSTRKPRSNKRKANPLKSGIPSK